MNNDLREWLNRPVPAGRSAITYGSAVVDPHATTQEVIQKVNLVWSSAFLLFKEDNDSPANRIPVNVLDVVYIVEPASEVPREVYSFQSDPTGNLVMVAIIHVPADNAFYGGDADPRVFFFPPTDWGSGHGAL